MKASPRIVKKRNATQKVLFIVSLFTCLILILLFATYKLHYFDSFITPLIKSPIPESFIEGDVVSGAIFAKNPMEEIIHDLKSAHVSFDRVYASSESAYIVTRKEGGEIILTANKDIALQVATLQLILTRLTIEGKSLSRIDLRFDKPVVVLR